MSPRVGVDGLTADLREVRALIGPRSAVYDRALEGLAELLGGPSADDTILERLEDAWRDRTFPPFYERPLLLLASVRAAALASPSSHPLAASFASTHPEPAAVTREALALARAPEQTRPGTARSTRRVQTNDVSRAIAWRWPARALGARPMILVDIGCAAGLNLVADALPPPWRDASGEPLLVAERPNVIERIGFDVSPIDARHVDESAWLRACIWPGDHARLDQLDEAIDAMVSAQGRPDAPRLWALEAAAVPARLQTITRGAPEGALVLAYQSFLREYLDAERAAAYHAAMRGWLDALPDGRAMWTEIELAERSGTYPAALVVHLPRRPPLSLARASYHPSRVDVDRDAVAALEAALAR